MSLIISDIHTVIGNKEILHGISMTVRRGEVHALMGPNGSGKSTFAYALMGQYGYTTHGSIRLDNKNISNVPTDARARAGLFLSLQSPIAVSGVTVTQILRTAYQERHKTVHKKQDVVHNPLLSGRWVSGGVSRAEFSEMLKKYANYLHIDISLLSRGIHDGFSGGERKKIEMLTALVLAPAFAVFDEIDTGLDVDALKLVAGGIEMLIKKGTGVVIITHYRRILKYVQPDVVHVLVNGKIVKTGKANLAKKIEEEGYAAYQ